MLQRPSLLQQITLLPNYLNISCAKFYPDLMKSHGNQKIQNRIEIVKVSVYLVSFVILAVSLFYPWVRSRYSAKEQFRSIYYKNIISHSSAMVEEIVSFLKKYEIAIRFLSNIGDNPQIVTCSVDDISRFINVSKRIRDSIDPSPTRVIWSEEDSIYCHIEWLSYNTSNFSIYIAFKVTGELFILKKYGIDTDFNDFDPFLSGTIIGDYTTQMSELYTNYTNNNMVSWTSPYLFNNDNSNFTQIFGVFMQPRNDNSSRIVTSISVNFSFLHESLEDIVSNYSIKYVLLNPSDEVLFENSLGETHFVNISGKTLFFPKLNELDDSLWEHVNGLLPNLTDGTVYDVTYNDSSYLLLSSLISIRNTTHFNLIVVIDLGQEIESVFLSTTIVFVSCIIVIFCTFIIMCFINVQKNKSVEPKIQETPLPESLVFDSVLLKLIFRLRRIQLALPDDQSINKQIDSSISQLTLNPEQIFSIECIKGSDDYLSNVLSFGSFDSCPYVDQKVYSYFSQLVLSKVGNYPNLGKLDFDYRYHQSLPINSFVKLALSYIDSHSIYMDEIDPSLFLLFLNHIAKKHLSFLLEASENIVGVSYFSLGPFSSYFKSPLEHLSVMFSILIMSLYRFENESMFFGDEAILSMQIRDFFLDFHLFIPNTNSIIMKYLHVTSSSILESTLLSKQLSFIGEIMTVSQGPDFSIENYSHRILIFKAIVILSFYSNIWHKGSPDILTKNNPIYQRIAFSKDLIINDHVKFTKKHIISPLIEVLNKFEPVDNQFFFQ